MRALLPHQVRRRLASLLRVSRRPSRGEDGCPKADAVVLMYHRVSEGHSDPWALSVAPRHFNEHMRILRQSGELLTLPDLATRVARGDDLQRALVVTFDDGYADNVRAALPILQSYQIPATVFIATGYIGIGREFWWDELEAVLLTPGRLPESFELSGGGELRRWGLPDMAIFSEADAKRHHAWREGQPEPSVRHRLYRELWAWLRLLRHEERCDVLDQLWRLSGRKREMRASHAVMTAEELDQLAQSPLIEIGAHTVSHPPLAAAAEEVQETELVTSKAWLEETLRRPVTSLSYPHGSYSEFTVAAARRAGYAVACSTDPAGVGPEVSLFAVPRMMVCDWSGKELASRLDAWLA